MPDNNTPPTTRNSTRWFKHFAIGDVIFCHKSSFSSLILRLWSISTLKRSCNVWHGRWIEFLQDYTFTLRHKAGIENKAADALSCGIFVLTKMFMVVNDFEKIKIEYESCPDFCDLYAILIDGSSPVNWSGSGCVRIVSDPDPFTQEGTIPAPFTRGFREWVPTLGLAVPAGPDPFTHTRNSSINKKNQRSPK